MPNGLNTELSPRLLPQLSFSEFTQCTVRGGVLSPRAGNVAYVPTPSSLEEWLLTQIGTNDTVRVYSNIDAQEYQVYTPVAGGTIKIIDAPSGTAEPLVLAAPTSAPAIVEWSASNTPGSVGVDPVPSSTGDGLASDATAQFASAVTTTTTIDGYYSGLSDVLDVKNETTLISFTVAMSPAQKPAIGATVTNTTKSETATVVGYSSVPSPIGYTDLLIDSKSSGKTQTWQDTDTITSASPAWSKTMAGDEVRGEANPTFEVNYTPGEAEATKWALYRLNTDGFWYLVPNELGSNPDVLADNIKQEYVDSRDNAIDWPGTYAAWPGPYDNNYLPEDVIGAFTTAKVQTVHKGCLFIAEGDQVRFSEAEQPRYFRDKFSLDAGNTILKIVSRGEIAEIHTPTDIRYIVGNSPYFEIRDTVATEGPVSKESITPTDVGTFALFDDGIYVVEGTQRRNITRGVLTPTIEALTSASGTVGGASKGIYYLVDTDGSGVAYDWEQDEWFAFDFGTQPTGFLYSDSARALIAKISGAYQAIGNGTTATAGAATWKEFGDGRLRKFQTRVHVDATLTSEVLMQFKADGSVLSGYPIDEPGEFPMPIDRAKFWAIRMSWTAKPSEVAIRSVELR